MVRLAAAVLLVAGCAEEALPLFTPLDGGVDGGQPFGVELVAAGFEHTCAIHQGALFCWGGNSDGELGVGDTLPRTRPTPLDAGVGWVELGVGYGSTCARRNDGSVWCWGAILGGLGSKLRPVQVTLPSSSSALSLHFNHACVIGMDRRLRCWGENQEGQLGLDDGFPGLPDQSAPMTLDGGQWASVSTGQGHTCAIATNGTLWCWGRNAPPQLGQPMGQPGQIRRPVQVGADTDWTQVRSSQNASCALKASGQMWCWGDAFDMPIGTRQIYQPERIGADTDWRTLELETFSICGLKTNGSLWCWGRNDEGQLGTGTTQSVYTPQEIGSGPWSSVAVARFHHCAIDAAGALFCTGMNDEGRLGVGDTLRRSVLTPVTF